jgi:hypothetical protein
MAYKWISIMGHFEHEKETIVFKGGPSTTVEGQVVRPIGNYLCDQYFGNGVISCEIEFGSSTDTEGCELILYYHAPTKAFITAGLGTAGLAAIRTWTGNEWIVHASAGDKKELVPKRRYQLSVSVIGSKVTIAVDGINVLTQNLPIPMPTGQAGIWCIGNHETRISSFKVAAEPSKIFIVMQFTPPYNELYSDVIIPVTRDLGLKCVRADETYGPGIIITDIVRQIVEARMVIADITPTNPNVYYEVGYAHALNKPTILIAENPTQLPFDVSPFRILFYENTIAGKNKIEEGLRKHLEAIQTQWATT